jgi:hypothetical protein
MLRVNGVVWRTPISQYAPLRQNAPFRVSHSVGVKMPALAQVVLPSPIMETNPDQGGTFRYEIMFAVLRQPLIQVPTNGLRIHREYWPRQQKSGYVNQKAQQKKTRHGDAPFC